MSTSSPALSSPTLASSTTSPTTAAAAALPESPPVAKTPAPAPPPPLDTSAPLLDQLLRQPAALSAALQAETDPAAVQATVRGLVQITALGAALYGVAIGLGGGVLQAVATGIKLPVVLLAGAGVSLPVLHVTTALAGRARLRFDQLSALVLQALATAAVAMAGLAPLVTVWWLTVSVGDASPWFVYRRVVLAAVAVAAAGGIVGAARALRAIPVPALVPWTAVLGLSMLQLAWLLRPIVGMPDQGFAVLRPLESDALTELLTALGAVLS